MHSVELAPLQVAHDASHGAQPVSLVDVQVLLWYAPAGQLGVQASQLTPPKSGW